MYPQVLIPPPWSLQHTVKAWISQLSNSPNQSEISTYLSFLAGNPARYSSRRLVNTHTVFWQCSPLNLNPSWESTMGRHYLLYYFADKRNPIALSGNIDDSWLWKSEFWNQGSNNLHVETRAECWHFERNLKVALFHSWSEIVFYHITWWCVNIRQNASCVWSCPQRKECSSDNTRGLKMEFRMERTATRKGQKAIPPSRWRILSPQIKSFLFI